MQAGRVPRGCLEPGRFDPLKNCSPFTRGGGMIKKKKKVLIFRNEQQAGEYVGYA